MHILITGLTGFVGSHLADYLLRNVPESQIYGIRRWRSPDENIIGFKYDPRVHLIEADLTDRGSLNGVLQQSRPDYVFHLAAQSFVQSSFVYPVKTLTTNVIGTTNLLDELRIAKQTGVCDPIILSCSSSEVYGQPLPEEVPIKETNPIRAANPYSISKVGHDLMSQYYHQAFGLKIIITRMFSHTGPRRGNVFAMSNFARQIVYQELQRREGKEPPYEIKVGNLDSLRTWAHVSDCVHAYWLAVTKGRIGEIYNIGGSETTLVGEALDRLLQHSLLPEDSTIWVVDPARIRPTDITLQIPDTAKFKQDTGWEPVKTLDNICIDLLTYWRERLQSWHVH